MGRARWLLVCGLAACDGEPGAGASTVAAEVWPGPQAVATPELEVRAVQTTWRVEGGRWHAEVELTLENVRAPIFDGTRSQRGGVVVDRAEMRLWVDGTSHEPVEPGELARALPATIGITPEVGSVRRGIVVFEGEGGSAPTDLTLELDARGRTLLLPLRGSVKASSGVPQRVVVVRGTDGRARGDVTAAVLHGADGAVPIEDLRPGEPLRLPVGGGKELEVTTAAGVWRGPLTADAVQTVEIEATSGFQAAVRLPDPPLDLDEVADGLASPDDVGTWVRDHIGVLPTTGLQRTPTAVLRRGAGGPLDRAELARVLLTRRGYTVQLSCGELPTEQAAAIYAPKAPPAVDGALGAAFAAAARDGQALGGVLAASLGGGLPQATRERVALVPEWCDVAWRDGDTWRQLDLRPAPWNEQDPVFAWRAFNALDADLWRVELVFRAIVRDGGALDGPTRTVDLARYATDAPTLSERGFLFDVLREGDGLRGLLSVIAPRDVAGEVGGIVPAASTDRVVVEVTWTDPLKVEPLRVEHVLWERSAGGGPPTVLRAIVTGEHAPTSASALSDWLHASYGGRWAAPAATELLAEMGIYGALYDHAAGGLVSAAPAVRVGVLLAEGSTWSRRVDEVAPLGPAVAGPTVDVAARGRLGAASWVARAELDRLAGRSVPALPQQVSWARTEPEVLALRFRDERPQMIARRAVSKGLYAAVDDAGSVWLHDPATAGVVPFGGPTIVAGPPPGSGPDGLSQLHEWWTVPVLCGALPLWHAAFGAGVASPAPCAPWSGP